VFGQLARGRAQTDKVVGEHILRDFTNFYKTFNKAVSNMTTKEIILPTTLSFDFRGNNASIRKN